VQKPSPARRTGLALLGAAPAFDEPLHVGRPNIGDRAAFASRLETMLDRRWLTNNGAYVRELEERIAGHLSVRHCVAVCNGTTALQIMAKACGLGGEVIMPSFTFVATAHAMEWQGVTPVFCDVDPVSHTIDPECARRLINSKTSAVLGVHVWGRGCEVRALADLAAEHDLSLCFDAAHAFACTHEGRFLGGSGAAEAFSFHATKFFNTMEGGAITTDDDEVACRCRRMRDFGFTGADSVESLGINGKMSEASAAMGLTNLDALQSFIDANERNYRAYEEALSPLPGISIIRYPEHEKNNYQYVVFEIDRNSSDLSRDDLHAVLQAENVLARRYFFPGCHKMAPYRDRPHPDGLRETERLTHRTLVLPTGTAVTPDHVLRIARIMEDALSSSAAVRTAVAARRQDRT
jgi:dTDP-4-amino-4,6-dideoxygalactose transaminase